MSTLYLQSDRHIVLLNSKYQIYQFPSANYEKAVYVLSLWGEKGYRIIINFHRLSINRILTQLGAVIIDPVPTERTGLQHTHRRTSHESEEHTI